jgi:hypothetical protein
MIQLTSRLPELIINVLIIVNNKITGQEKQEKSREAIRRLKEEKQRLEAEAKLKLETAERNLEQVRANELQELRRGKVEALQVLQVI